VSVPGRVDPRDAFPGDGRVPAALTGVGVPDADVVAAGHGGMPRADLPADVPPLGEPPESDEPPHQIIFLGSEVVVALADWHGEFGYGRNAPVRLHAVQVLSGEAAGHPANVPHEVRVSLEVADRESPGQWFAVADDLILPLAEARALGRFLLAFCGDGG
jgi:hypothetical protein